MSTFDIFGDKPIGELFCKFLDIIPKNIFLTEKFSLDPDKVIRPIGYLNVLVNNFNKN